jgi:hypothetical protein
MLGHEAIREDIVFDVAVQVEHSSSWDGSRFFGDGTLNFSDDSKILRTDSVIFSIGSDVFCDGPRILCDGSPTSCEDSLLICDSEACNGSRELCDGSRVVNLVLNMDTILDKIWDAMFARHNAGWKWRCERWS